MTISELIERLQKVQEEVGDVPVIIETQDAFTEASMVYAQPSRSRYRPYVHVIVS